MPAHSPTRASLYVSAVSLCSCIETAIQSCAPQDGARAALTNREQFEQIPLLLESVRKRTKLRRADFYEVPCTVFL